MVLPEAIGFRLNGKLKEGVTATDLALTVTQTLRKRGVVWSFVEFFGPGLDNLTIEDRATIGNMPQERRDLRLLPGRRRHHRLSDQDGAQDRACGVAKATKAQGMYRTKTTPDPGVHRCDEA